MSEHPGRDRHRRRTFVLLIAMLIVILGGVSAVMASAEFLDQYGLLRFPLGFYLLAQGLLFVLVAAAFWAASVQDEIDRSYAESEEP